MKIYKVNFAVNLTSVGVESFYCSSKQVAEEYAMYYISKGSAVLIEEVELREKFIADSIPLPPPFPHLIKKPKSYAPGLEKNKT